MADVRYAGPVRRGDASIEGDRSVILSVQKQPGADTLVLTEKIEKTLADMQQRLPKDVVIVTDIFRQADFIDAAIDNVKEAIRDGVIWVIVVLFIFLWNLRTSLITLTAIPLSIIITALVFSYFGISINTMTLGGLAVAIGELVDDSIVDIENIFRRLKENYRKPNPQNPLKVIFLASCEVRNSIVYATLIVVLVVFPLFSLAGLEGRMFAPLGLAYLTTLLASLVVSLTVTPVLASYLLFKKDFLKQKDDPFLLRWLKWADSSPAAVHLAAQHGRAGDGGRARAALGVEHPLDGRRVPAAIQRGFADHRGDGPAGREHGGIEPHRRAHRADAHGDSRSEARLPPHRPGGTGRTCRERQLLRDRRRPDPARRVPSRASTTPSCGRFPDCIGSAWRRPAGRETKSWPKSARLCAKSPA